MRYACRVPVGDLSDELHAPASAAGEERVDERSGAVRSLPAPSVPAFVQLLLDPRRSQPVVAVTTRHGAALLDADLLARAIGDAATVVTIPTGDATRALAARLPEKLCVYGGAGRIWWPGLTPESDPYEHPLIWVRPGAAREAERRIVATLGRRVPLPGAPAPGDVVRAEVVALDGHGADLEVGLVPARCHITRLARGWVHDPADVLRAGQTVTARVCEVLESGGMRVDLSDVQADEWEVLADQVRPGDVVRGRVCGTSPSGVTLELLPGVFGRIPPRALDGYRTLREGEVITATIDAIDPMAQRAALSSVTDPAVAPTPLRLLPGGPAFLAHDAGPGADGADGHAHRAAELAERLSRLEREAQDLRAHAERLGERLRQERERNRSLTRDLEAARRRLAQLATDTAAGAPRDPEEGWRARVHSAYDRLYTGEDRTRYPLADVRVLPGFARSADGLDGIDEERIAEVCAHVAAGRAHEIGGLRIHPRRDGGPAGAPRVREDGARAWRASLQVGAPAARRLHYWVMTRDGRRTVELEAVGTHDERM